MLNVSFFGFPFVYAGFLRFLLDFLNVSFAPIHPYIRGKNPLCKLKIQLTFSPGKPQRWSEQTTPFSRSKPPGHCPAGSAGIKEGKNIATEKPSVAILLYCLANGYFTRTLAV